MKKILVLLLFLAINNVCAAWLIWDAPPAIEQVSQYRIYRVQGQNLDLIGVTIPPTTKFDVANFVQGNRSVFCIKAVNINGESLESTRHTVQKR